MVRERYREVVWDGAVEVFTLHDHPKAQSCYAWYYHDEMGTGRYVIALRIPPIVSAAAAVRTAIEDRSRSG
jgi:hypothetical protein